MSGSPVSVIGECSITVRLVSAFLCERFVARVRHSPSCVVSGQFSAQAFVRRVKYFAPCPPFIKEYSKPVPSEASCFVLTLATWWVGLAIGGTVTLQLVRRQPRMDVSMHAYAYASLDL